MLSRLRPRLSSTAADRCSYQEDDEMEALQEAVGALHRHASTSVSSLMQDVSPKITEPPGGSNVETPALTTADIKVETPALTIEQVVQQAVALVAPTTTATTGAASTSTTDSDNHWSAARWIESLPRVSETLAKVLLAPLQHMQAEFEGPRDRLEL
eukprot:1619364-Prymnesium_polylepis.1